MKLYNRILIILSVILIFNSPVFAVEVSLEDIAKEISEVREEISKLQPSNIKQAIVIDKALEELDQAIEFVGKRVNNGDIKGAVSTLNFIDRSMSDIGSTIPKEYKSKKVKENIREFSKEEMNEIMVITGSINKNKNKKMTVLIDGMVESTSKGLDTLKISEKISDMGIETINKEEIEKAFTRANIAKKQEIQNNIVSLNEQLQNSINLINSKQTKLNKNQKLTEQYGKEIENFSKQISKIDSQATSLTAKIDDLTKEINAKTLSTNELNQQVVSLNTHLQNSANLINSKQTSLSQFQNSLSPVQDQLLALNKERDIINKDVDSVLSKEVHDFNKFEKFIGNSEEDIVMALRQVDALMESDPRKTRAFDYEIYAKKVGIPNSEMEAGIQSILSGDYNGEEIATQNLISKLANSNITSFGKDEISQESKNALKNNPALIDQSADKFINSYKTQDTAIYKIIDAAKNGIDPNQIRSNFDPVSRKRFANNIKGILMSDPKMVEEGNIEYVYLDLLYNGPTEKSAAYAQVKLSDDTNIESAYFTAAWNFSGNSKMRVAAE